MTNDTIRVSHRKHAAPIPEGWKQRWHSRLANAAVLSVAYWLVVGFICYMLLSATVFLAPYAFVVGAASLIIYAELARVFLRRSGY